MMRPPQRYTRTDPLFPYPTLFRSVRRRLLLRTLSRDSPPPLPKAPARGRSDRADRRPSDRPDPADRGGPPIRNGPESPGWSHKAAAAQALRSEEHTSELQSLMPISYAVFRLTKKKHQPTPPT